MLEAEATGAVAAAMAAERESLSVECRLDAARLSRLIAPDFHEFGASGGELTYADAAASVAETTRPDDEPVAVHGLRGWLIAGDVVMIKYTSERGGRRANRTSLWRHTAENGWQIFHHQGTPTGS